MSVQIKEMHIRINVDEGLSSGNAQSNKSSSGSDDATIALCLEEVFEKLRDQKER